jgi:SAM-dependent methyltransferase
MQETDKKFAGAIPKIYDTYFVPMIFQPYAVDMAERLKARAPSRVLETAAGTGVVTRALASALPASTAITATDLNQTMLDHAAAVGVSRPVQWRQADAMKLPFPDASFDAVACQFGAMFFPDKPKAFAEVRRVLAPGGVFIFNVWDRIEDNEFTHVVCAALRELFPKDPPEFMARTPHGYHDLAAIRRDLRDGGFPTPPRIDTVAARSRAASAREVAMAICQGTPLRGEIESRDASKLEEATALAVEAVARRFGRGPVEGKIQAHVITVI